MIMMDNQINSDFFNEIKARFMDVDPEEVLAKARKKGLNVFAIRDFRDKKNDYGQIEDLMREYVDSSSSSNALTGISTGLGGFTTAVTLGSLDLASVSLILYRLSQQLAILNGLDLNEAMNKKKAQEIYFTTLGFNAATQSLLRKKLLRATSMASTKSASKNMLLKFIVITSKMLGMKLSYKSAGRMIPIIGGAAGAWINYTYTREAGDQMIKAYKKDYFRERV